ncbi:hypothetical protein SAMN06264364_11395 [Quadrisphaera granulorum]|uniref:Uncharacterized protein n=1 Tax=Quadrisphaera granulorum TaxID=317664 RepID=A0A316A5Z6_9ACTN|nr:hypothetical protein [Quadrisphaera granulorum]PWJ53336.1 hypothetical protein BXY45_11395 [Quadrisphaera granulorum]SZE97010.1 hypothetical protein SAMN06264364_11395 [Quadrisphaera granulorum]
MIVLAVLLLLAVALVVLFVAITGITPTVTLEWSQISTSVTLTALGVFLLGAVCLLVAEMGLALLLRGNRKNWERRRELRRLRRVEAERARHATAAEQSAPATSASPSPSPSTTTAATVASPGTGESARAGAVDTDRSGASRS